VDTINARVASTFSGAPATAATANGGMWSSGGPAIDANGHVFITTGNSPAGSGNSPRVWGQSVLEWAPQLPLQPIGTDTPFTYCQMDTADIDLAGSAPMIVPDLNPATTGTPHLMAFGGKQGNVYLLSRDRLPGRLDQRPPCGSDSTTDLSLLPPGP